MCNKEQGYYQSEMTTPTREQVNKLLEMTLDHFPSLPLSDEYTDWNKWSEFAQAAFLFGASEARADLEATIAEKDAEIERLKSTPPYQRQDLHCVVSDISAECRELRQQLVAEQAHIEVLREALEEIANWLVCAPIASAIDMAQSFPHMYSVAEKSLAIQSSTDALREHDEQVKAEFIERSGKWLVNDAILREHDAKLIVEFVGKFKRHVGGDGEFWLHELEDFAEKIRKGEF